MEMAHRMSLFSRVGIRLSARPQAGTKPAPGGAIETVTVTMFVDEARSLIDTLDGRWSNDDMTVHAHLGLLLGERRPKPLDTGPLTQYSPRGFGCRLVAVPLDAAAMAGAFGPAASLARSLSA